MQQPVKSFHYKLVLCLIALFFSATCIAHAENAPSKGRIAFLPFEIHAQKDLEYLKEGIRDMLASRLSATTGASVVNKAKVSQAVGSQLVTTPGQAEAIGKRLTADYIVSGSITSLGSSFSMDAKVFPVGAGSVETFFATAAKEDDVILAVDSLAWDIAERMFGKKRPGSEATATPVGIMPSQSPLQTAHPQKAFIGKGGQVSDTMFIKPNPITGSYSFTKSQNIPFGIQAMDVGDVDGDSVNEVVLAGRNKVVVYKESNGRLTQLYTMPVLARFKVVYLSMADLNNNGRDEIYVTSVDKDDVDSFSFEWQGNGFEYGLQNARYYIRVLDYPGSGEILAGQRSDVNAPVRPGIFILEMDGNRVTEGKNIPLPSYINLYDFAYADLTGDLQYEIVAINPSDRILVLRGNGAVMWISDEHYGGSTRYIGEDFGMENPEEDNLTIGMEAGEDRIYIPARIIVEDINNDGISDIVLNKNLSTASRLFQNFKSYPSGEIHGLSWNGLALTELWRTKKIDGYIADYQVKITEDKTGAELFVGLIMRGQGMDILSKSSTVLTFNLALQQEEEKK